MGDVLIGISSALLAFAAAWIALPKIRAEARKLNVEADGLVIDRLVAEVDRLQQQRDEDRAEIDQLRKDFDASKEASANRERELEVENSRLLNEVRLLKRRVRELESVIKIVPITPDMQEMLDEIDRKTGGKK